MSSKKIDQINKKTMQKSIVHYSWKDALTPAEIAAIRHVEDAQGKPILDLGVGAGRTAVPLREISDEYIGIDYVHEMVEECSRKFPELRFEHGDARDLSQFEDNSFYLIMFSMNGISMVDHHDRIKILKEVHRILMPGGSFLFSTYNQDSDEYKKLLVLPEFDFSWNPLRLFVRSIRYGSNLVKSGLNRCRFKKYEIHTPEYSMVNDVCHNYATLLYYISQENQIKQLASAGFDGESVAAFDLSGEKIKDGTKDGSIFYVVKKGTEESVESRCWNTAALAESMPGTG